MTKQLKVGDTVRLRGTGTKESAKVVEARADFGGGFRLDVPLNGLHWWNGHALEFVVNKREQLSQLTTTLIYNNWVTLADALYLAVENASDGMIDELYGIFYRWGKREDRA